MKKHLNAFKTFRKEQITFDSFDVEFYEEFGKFLTYDIQEAIRIEVNKRLKLNSIGNTIKHLKSFLRYLRPYLPYAVLRRMLYIDTPESYCSFTNVTGPNKPEGTKGELFVK